MKDLIIEKPSFRFTVEVIPENDHIHFKVKRYVDVGSREEMSMNAQMARFEAIRFKGKHYNCHELLHTTLDVIGCLLTEDCQVEVPYSRNITLTKTHVFGQ